MNEAPIFAIHHESELMPQVYALRHEVFVVEQAVPVELEIDEYDEKATHVVYVDNDAVVGTLRIVDKGEQAKIGRVAVKKSRRGEGLGREMMLFALEQAKLLGFTGVFLESQTYAIGFYAKLGFQEEGEEFMDAGIPHRKMVMTI